MFKIVQKKNHNAVYASGFWDIERAQAWLATYNPQHWMEKDVTRDDLEIIAETKKQQRSA
jgi:hypothetical protein